MNIVHQKATAWPFNGTESIPKVKPLRGVIRMKKLGHPCPNQLRRDKNVDTKSTPDNFQNYVKCLFVKDTNTVSCRIIADIFSESQSTPTLPLSTNLMRERVRNQKMQWPLKIESLDTINKIVLVKKQWVCQAAQLIVASLMWAPKNVQHPKCKLNTAAPDQSTDQRMQRNLITENDTMKTCST